MKNSLMYRMFVFVLTQLLLIQFCIEPAAAATSKTGSLAVEKVLKLAPLHQKKMTVKEFYSKFSQQLGPGYQKVFAPYIDILANEEMPQVTVTKYQDTDGSGVRLLLQKGNQTANVDLIMDDVNFMKVNNVLITNQEMNQAGPAFHKIQAQLAMKSTADKKTSGAGLPFVTLDQWKALSIKQKGALLMKVRELNQAIENVQKFDQDSDVSSFLQIIFGEEAQAATLGNACIVAGYISAYGKSSSGKLSCGAGDGEVRSAQKSCGGGRIECNPTIFGSGTCVSLSNPRDVSVECDKQNKIDTVENQEKFLQKLMKDPKFALKDGKVPSDKYEEYIKTLGKMKDVLSIHWKEICHYELDSKGLPAAGSKSSKSLKIDQQDACEALKKRYFELEKLVEELKTQAVTKVEACDADQGLVSNQGKDADKKPCVCKEGYKEEKSEKDNKEMKCVAVAAPAVAAATKPTSVPPAKEIKDKDGFPWMTLLMGASIGMFACLAGLLNFISFCDKEPKVTNNYHNVTNTYPTTVILPPYQQPPRLGEGARNNSSGRAGAVQ